MFVLLAAHCLTSNEQKADTKITFFIYFKEKNVTSTSLPQQATLTSSVASSTNATTAAVSLTSTTDYCEVAKKLCTSRCQGEYLVDPIDCTYCVCKSDLIMGWIRPLVKKNIPLRQGDKQKLDEESIKKKQWKVN